MTAKCRRHRAIRKLKGGPQTTYSSIIGPVPFFCPMPIFEQRDGKLVVRGQPVAKKVKTGQPIVDRRQVANFFSEHNALFRTAASVTGQVRNQAEEAHRNESVLVALGILDELHRETKARKTPLVIALMPELRELSDPDSSKVYHAVARVVGEFATERNVPFVDFCSSFADAGPANVGSYYLPEQWHHFSRSGNRLVAEGLDAFLAGTFPDYPVP